MEQIKRFIESLVLTDIYASLIASMIAILFVADFGGGINLWAAGMIFSEAFIIYALNRQIDVDIDAINHPERTEFLSKNRLFVLVPAVALFAAMATHAFLTNMLVFWAMIAIFISSLFYNFPIIPSFLSRLIGFSRFKEAFFLKNLSIGAMYGMFVIIPALVAGFAINTAVLVLFAFVAVRFFIVSVVFDLRDIEGDEKLGIKTIPLELGRNNTVALLQWINILSLAMVVAAFLFSDASRLFLAVATPTVLFGHFYIQEAQKQNTNLKFICGYVAEADIVPAVLALLIFTASGIYPL